MLPKNTVYTRVYWKTKILRDIESRTVLKTNKTQFTQELSDSESLVDIFWHVFLRLSFIMQIVTIINLIDIQATSLPKYTFVWDKVLSILPFHTQGNIY